MYADTGDQFQRSSIFFIDFDKLSFLIIKLSFLRVKLAFLFFEIF